MSTFPTQDIDTKNVFLYFYRHMTTELLCLSTPTVRHLGSYLEVQFQKAITQNLLSFTAPILNE